MSNARQLEPDRCTLAVQNAMGAGRVMSRPTRWGAVNSSVALLLLSCFWPLQVARAVVVSDSENDHVVLPGRQTYGVNLDGVAQLGWEGAGEPSIHDVLPNCSGSLITDRHVLTAAHCFDEDGDGQVDSLIRSFPFLAAFELADGPVFIPVDVAGIDLPAGWPEQNADVAVATLMKDAPADIPRYALYGDDQEVGRPIVVAGYGDIGHGATGADADLEADLNVKRAGRNRYEAVRDDMETPFLAYDFDSGLPDNNALDLIGFESDLGFGVEEVASAAGDSGGPVFITGVIAGVTAFGEQWVEPDVNSLQDSSWGEVSFDTRVSAFQQFILEATEGQALFVHDGDYTKDGTVDGQDFLLWQRQHGATEFTAADGDGDGTVTEADLMLWTESFGQSTGSAGTNAVPEPTAVMLLIGGVFSIQLARWRLVSYARINLIRVSSTDFKTFKIGRL